jgi:hypothetical protein
MSVLDFRVVTPCGLVGRLPALQRNITTLSYIAAVQLRQERLRVGIGSRWNENVIFGSYFKMS